MKYMGSKSKVAKFIVPIIQEYIDKTKPWAYIEPFCGGCNIIDKVAAPKRFAHDKQKYLIALLQNLNRLDSLPEFVSKKLYDDVRECYNRGTEKYSDWYIGAIGFLASYNGRFFDGGYAGIVKTKAGPERNYYKEALANLKAQAKSLKGVEFICGDYRLIDTENAVIYCDPPYDNTKEYSVSRKFDYEEFWRWVRKMSVNNIVLVSCNEAPEDFECIWQKDVKRTMNSADTKLRAIERLYIIKKQED